MRKGETGAEGLLWPGMACAIPKGPKKNFIPPIFQPSPCIREAKSQLLASDSPRPELPCPLRGSEPYPGRTPAPVVRLRHSASPPRPPAPPRRPRRLGPRRCRVGDPARRLRRCARGRPAPRRQDCSALRPGPRRRLVDLAPAAGAPSWQCRGGGGSGAPPRLLLLLLRRGDFAALVLGHPVRAPFLAFFLAYWSANFGSLGGGGKNQAWFSSD